MFGALYGVIADGNTPAPAPVFATWNPADKAATVVLTDGNLRANTSDAATCMARSTIGKSAGKWYWEFVPEPGSSTMIGVALASADLNMILGFSAGGFAYYNISGVKYTGLGVPAAYGATWSSVDTIGIALDMDAGTLEMFKNNASQGILTGGLAGTIFAGIGFAGDAGDGGTANFGATALTFAPPAGFHAGLFT